jgi:hypothetical protein
MLHATTAPEWDGNWQLFAQALMDHFGPLDPIGDAEDGITQLKMRDNARIHEYQLEFDLYASYLKWNEGALRYQYYRGLPTRIKDGLVTHEYDNTLKDLQEESRRIDARHWRRETEKQREKEMRRRLEGSGGGQGGRPGNSGSGSGKSGSGKNSSSSGNANQSSSNNSGQNRNNNNSGQRNSGNQGSGKSSGSGSGSGTGGGSGKGGNQQQKQKKPYADKLTKTGKLTAEERERRTKNNLCMYCGEAGHSASDCPKRRPETSGRAATTQPTASTSATPATEEPKK